MGFASASREEKLAMMKTNKTRKITRKLNVLGRKGKISRTIKDGLHSIKAKKSRDSRQRVLNIQDDWTNDREAHYNQDEEDLPLDMLDADIDWENSSFANVKRRHDQRLEGGIESKRRKFEGQLDEDVEELLPVKLADGRLMRPTREKEKTSSDNDDSEEEVDEKEEEEKEAKFEDFSHLSAAELILKRRSMKDEFKATIASHANMLLTNPHENVLRLKELHSLCQGEKVHSLVREDVQKLAIASLLQVFIDIIPGYAIRPQTAEEKSQKQKKETRKLVTFEETLLRYYLKFLQLCEKLSAKLCKKKIDDESTFTFKIGLLSVKSLARLAVSVPHFNYSTNIVSTLVRISLARNTTVCEEACGALAKIFKEDLSLKITLFGARSISTLVTKKKGRVPPQLISTFLSMNIREVKNEDKKSSKDGILAKKYRLKKERANKTARKYKKQLDKLEADLKEVEAEESLTTKLKHATEAMKFVFQTYFSILKRLPNIALLGPVLEGLSKFAHLLSVEFFEDVISTTEKLIDRNGLSLLNRLNCISTVFIILSGDGQLLNVDPSKFYRTMYRLINLVAFEMNSEQRLIEVQVMTRTLDLMLNARRKLLSIGRTAAFVKRLLSISTILDDASALCMVAFARTVFIAHPKLSYLVDQDDEEHSASNGIFCADLDDPDVANVAGTSVRSELSMLTRRRQKELSQFASNIYYGVPSTGPFKLSPQITNIKAWDLIEQVKNRNGNTEIQSGTKYLDDIKNYAKKHNKEVAPGNVHFHISSWLDSKKN